MSDRQAAAKGVERAGWICVAIRGAVSGEHDREHEGVPRSLCSLDQAIRGDHRLLTRTGERKRENQRCPDTAAYGATKAALASFARSWAAEYGPAGVRVNAISPGPVYTNAAERDVFDSLGETTVLGRAGQPQEVADVIGFLASPRASYITGTNVAVDGGRAGT